MNVSVLAILKTLNNLKKMSMARDYCHFEERNWWYENKSKNRSKTFIQLLTKIRLFSLQYFKVQMIENRFPKNIQTIQKCEPIHFARCDKEKRCMGTKYTEEVKHWQFPFGNRFFQFTLPYRLTINNFKQETKKFLISKAHYSLE